MEPTIKSIATTITLLFALSFTINLGVFAAQKDSLLVGKKGMVRLTTTAKVGDVQLKPGMYHIQHQMEGNDHAIVFLAVSMPGGYKEYQMNEGKEVARLKCKVEPAKKKVSNTTVKLGTNAAGEKVIEEVQVPGELFIHKFN